MKNKKSFTITCLDGSFCLVLALGIVYNWRLALVTLAMLFVVGTIWENFKGD